MRDFWGRKSICLVTGASQNIGRSLAEGIASRLGSGSILILTSRVSDKLGVVRQAVYESNPNVRVELLEWDLARPDGEKFKGDLLEALKDWDPMDYELALIVHNARTNHELKSNVVHLSDAAYIQEHLNINLVSMLVSNCSFWSVLDGCREKVLINMTSVPEQIDGLTAVSRMSRSVALNILANESPEIRVLHYSPGAVDASTIQSVIRSTRDPQIARRVQEMFEQNKILEPQQTVRVLLDFLAENEIESGQEIDAQHLLRK